MKGEKPKRLVIPELEELAGDYVAVTNWSADENEVLRSYYGRVAPQDIANYLEKTFGLKRTRQAVIRRAYILRQRGEL